MILLLWIIVPDINQLWADPVQGYIVYFTIGELFKAFVAAWFVRNAYGYCGAVWFVTQAINESTANNTWQTDSWEEYAAFAALALAAYLFHRYR